MLFVDNLNDAQAEIDNKWVIARPVAGTFIDRIKDAWKVLTGKCEAVKFYKQ